LAMEEGHNTKVCQLFHNAIEIIGRRWTGAIIYSLCSGPKRFCEFNEAIPELSSRLLTERLKELEEYGLIRREVSTERPIQVSYSLTEKGLELQPIFENLGEWANKWKNQPAETGILK
jgi:DNA-binding HxlR family transcriptional regulator